ncbi:hypothetical protein IV498_09910 [Paenarthrobacter sp. Z7-10]|uniref:DUF6297 family protein n=1 Tax=Paenarthrobacter sp. Z7-10 TaxID=2787635 RepID=UPI0022A94818|nr:DUF6297 family protein [Paenarthrobacter sp. Z7-10]MCZ2403487.1 hypothetical protein [Paenarthrobacter sp. Z7-10]
MTSHPAESERTLLSAREIRRYTFKVGLARSEGGIGELISEAYTYVFAAIVLVVMSGAIVLGLRHSLGLGSTPVWSASALSPGFQSLAPLQASATLMLTLAAALLNVQLNLGPIAMTVPQTFWWLGLPVRRRGFISPGFLRSMIWPVAGGIAVVVPLSLGIGSQSSPGLVALATLCGAALALFLYGTAGWVQITGRGRWLGTLAAAVTLVAPLSLVGTALYNNVSGTRVDMSWLLYLPTSWPLLVANGALWPLLLVAVALAVLVLVYANLERVSSASLRASAVASAYVAGSVLSMDASELSKSLSSGTRSGTSWIRLPLVFRSGSQTRRSVLTMLSAHLTMQLRQPTRLIRVLVLAAIPASLASVQFLGNATLIAVVLYFCAHFAVTGLGAVARFAAGNPSVDALMPLPAKLVRQVHYVLPAAGMTLWMILCFVLLHVLGVGSWTLIILALLAGPGLGGATLRAAFRPTPDWNMPAVSTAMGPVPTGAIRSFLVGPDLTLIALLPTLICLISGGVPLLAYPVQLGLSLIGFGWGCRLRKPKRSKGAGGGIQLAAGGR